MFSSDYKLRTLDELNRYISENKHLPGIPSSKEIYENGLDLASNQAKLLEKIEELTLYLLEMKHDNDELKCQLDEIKNSLQIK